MSWNILPKNVLQYFLEKIKSKFLLIRNHDILGAKNILPFPYTYGSGTSHGLTVTVNEDGSVTAQGTPTQNVSFSLNSDIINDLDLSIGDKVIFSEWEVDNQSAFAALLLNPSTAISEVRGDYTLTVTSEMVQDGVSFILFFSSGVDLTTPITFKPMVRLATDPDSTWYSPALTNKQLTENVTYLHSHKSHVSANPSTTTGTLTSIEIDGTGYTFPGSSSVTGVKGSNESNYRTGNVNVSANNVGALGVVGNVTVSSLDELVALCLNSGNNKAFEGPINISTDIGVGITGWCNTIGACLNAPNNGSSNIGLFCLFMSTNTSVSPRYAIINGKTTGNYSVTTTGVFTRNADLATVATSGSYNDLTNKPTIPDISTKVSKSGDTMSGMLDTTYKVGTWVGSLTKSAINLSEATGSFGGLISAPTKNGRIAIATYQGNDDKLYIGYGEKGRTTNSYTRSIAWNGATGLLEASITGDAGSCNGYTLGKSVPSNAVFTDTNNAVTQTNTTGTGTYRVLFSATADDTNRTESARKGRLYWDPGNVMLSFSGGMRIQNYTNKSLSFMTGTDSNHGLKYQAYNQDDNQWGLMPMKDGWLGLGHQYLRWGQIYSSNSAISTSDRNEKKDIVPLDESAKDFIMSLNPVSYKFKNGESGRTHYGMIAQDVEEEMAKLGMTTMDFAGLIKYPKKKQVYETINGSGQFKDIPIEGEHSYGLRYEEFMAPAIKTIQLLQEEVDLLKQRIDILEEKLNG